MDKKNLKEANEKVQAFFAGNEKFVEFDLTNQVESRLDFACWLMRCSSKWFYTKFTIAKIAEVVPLSWMKIFLYRRIGVKIGKDVYIAPGVIIDPVFPELVTLEDYCILGWGSHIFTHELSVNKLRIGRVHIKRGSIIGGFSTVRCGVVIGENVQTAMHTFIYKDIPNGGVAL